MYATLSEISGSYALFVDKSVLRDDGLLVETEDGEEELVEDVTALKSWDPEAREITLSLPRPSQGQRPAPRAD